MTEPRSLLTLWTDAVPSERIAYPTYTLKKSLGKGETTYELPKGDGPILRALQREAVEGELLRGPDLKFIPDWTDNLRFRKSIREQCQANPKGQELERKLCKSNILYFINTYVFTYDPRLKRDRTIPFVTYPFQDEHIGWIVWKIFHDESGLTEKSRDMGASWMYVAVVAWLCLFYPQMSADFMSQIEDDVDNRTTDSLLGKVRFLLKNLPEWMRGGWVERGEGCDIKMNITIPQTGSVIRGLLSRGTAGRSGRASIVIPDEWAFVEDSEKVLNAINDLSACILFLGTANGMANAQYRMRSDPATDLQTLHWRKSPHPLKNEEWAKLRLADPRVTDQGWASEHEIDYAGSTPGKVYDKFITVASANHPWAHCQQGPLVEYDPHFDVFTGQDYGVNDMCFICYFQERPAPPEYLPFTNTTLVFFDEDYGSDETVDGWRYLLNSKGYRYREHVGDARTGNQRDSLGSTWIKNFRRDVEKPVNTKRFGQVIPGPPIIIFSKYNSEFAPIQTVQKLLSTPGAIAVNEKKCPMTVMAFQNWAFPTEQNPLTGEETAIPGSKPNHDQFSHPMKAVAYVLDWRYGSSPRSNDNPSDEWDYPALKLGIR